MKTTDFSQSNQLLPTKAGNMPVFIGVDGEIISRWHFTWKEIWQLIRGNRSVFIAQYPQSVAFPTFEVGFHELTEEEKEKIKDEAVRKEAEDFEKAKKQKVIDDRNARNPQRLRRLREVAKEQGLYKTGQNETKAQKETL